MRPQAWLSSRQANPKRGPAGGAKLGRDERARAALSFLRQLGTAGLQNSSGCFGIQVLSPIARPGLSSPDQPHIRSPFATAAPIRGSGGRDRWASLCFDSARRFGARCVSPAKKIIDRCIFDSYIGAVNATGRRNGFAFEREILSRNALLF
jgi:hypothetical protein